MRLIDADKLKDFINKWLSYDYKTRVDLTAVKIPNKWLNALIKCIDNQPTVCDIEQIRDEIEEASNRCNNAIAKGCYLFCLGVIDKYMEE